MRSRTRRRLDDCILLALLVVAILGGALSAGAPAPNQDVDPPDVEITSPPKGSVVTSPTLSVSGTASDNEAVATVHLSTNGQTWATASGTTMWNGTVTLVNGSNTVFARATDSEGNQATDSITVIAQFPDGGPAERGALEFLSNPFILGALVTAIVLSVGTVAYIRRRRRRLGNGIDVEFTGIQEEGREKPPSP